MTHDREREPATRTGPRVSGEITSVADGLVVGWIERATAGDHVGLFVERRLLGSQPLTLSDRPGRCAFALDARNCPPALLLKDHLDLRVELSARPGEAVATLVVRTEDLLRLERVRSSRKSPGFEGCVDGVTDGVLRGWAHDRRRGERRLDLLLFVGDRFAGRFRADRPRADLAAAGHGDGTYGFEIPIRSISAARGPDRPVFTILAGDPELWPIPIGRHASDGLTPAETRLRDLPRTIESFARLMASREPFPKKVFVLDALNRGAMPDAFKADYVYLALEMLRHEMVATGEAMGGGLRHRMGQWAHMRAVGFHIRRLEDLATAITAGPALLKASAASRAPVGDRHADRKS